MQNTIRIQKTSAANTMTPNRNRVLWGSQKKGGWKPDVYRPDNRENHDIL
jgi:hypothetical protein